MGVLVTPNGYVVQFDDVDIDLIKQHGWRGVNRNYGCYVTTDINYKSQYLHRMLMTPKEGLEIDHVDGNGLNNRRNNLRVCTHAENSRNIHSVIGASKDKVVYWRKERSRWVARIKVNYEVKWLGSFADEIDAAMAYNNAAVEHFGQFAQLNEV